jgi:hypothetical protein
MEYSAVQFQKDKLDQAKIALIGAGVMVGRGSKSQIAAALFDALLFAIARGWRFGEKAAPVLSDAEYRAEMAASDARLLEARLAAPWLDAKGHE